MSADRPLFQRAAPYATAAIAVGAAEASRRAFLSVDRVPEETRRWAFDELGDLALELDPDAEFQGGVGQSGLTKLGAVFFNLREKRHGLPIDIGLGRGSAIQVRSTGELVAASFKPSILERSRGGMRWHFLPTSDDRSLTFWGMGYQDATGQWTRRHQSAITHEDLLAMRSVAYPLAMRALMGVADSLQRTA